MNPVWSGFTVCLLVLVSVRGQERVVCYWASWATYREGAGGHEVSDIDPNICTHVIYHTADIDPTTFNITSADPYNDLEEDYGKGNYKKFTALKSNNTRLKTMLSCQADPGTYSQMSNLADSRAGFIASVVDFMQEFGFDGLDVVWLYPSGEPDKTNFVSLLTELRARFDEEGYVLSAMFPTSETIIDSAYGDVGAISDALHFFNVLTYDYHGAWETITGHHSQLDDPAGSTLSVSGSLSYWTELGAATAKLNLGVPCYCRGWTLSTAADNGVGAATAGSLPPATYSQTDGMWFYFEFCEQFSSDVWSTVYDETIVAPYSYSDTLWLGYDDGTSAVHKAEFIKSSGYGGAMVYTLDSCDFSSMCGNGRYPIVKGLYDTLVEGTTPSTVVVTSEPPATNTLPSATSDKPTATPSHLPPATNTLPSATSDKPTATPSHLPPVTSPDLPTVSSPDPPPVTSPAPVVTTTPSGSVGECGQTIPECVQVGLLADPSGCCQNYYSCTDNDDGSFTQIEFMCDDGLMFDPELQVCNFPDQIEECN